MLERAASYVEPASQAFIQRCDTPLRSSRLLARHFFKHGASAVEPPPWWPLYLETVRQIPYSIADRSRAGHADATAPGARGRRATPSIRTSVNPKHVGIPGRVRPYTATASLSAGRTRHDKATEKVQEQDDEDEEEEDEDEEEDGADHDEDVDEDVGIEYQARLSNSVSADQAHATYRPLSNQQTEPVLSGLGKESIDTQANKPDEVPGTELKSAAQAELDELLDLASAQIFARRERLEHSEAVWKSFIALTDQESHASRVLAYLATSTNAEDWKRGYSVFEIIPPESLVPSDYDHAVQVALRLKQIPLVVRLCKAASERDLADLARQTALVGLLQLGLYKNAVRVWEACFAPRNLQSRAARLFLPHSKVALIDNTPKLADILLKLCHRLTREDSLLSAKERASMLRIAKGLAWRVVASGQNMSTITLEGLLRVFDHLNDVGLLEHQLLATAIRTLASQRRVPRARHDLAVAIYRNSRLRFPDDQVDAQVLHGMLHLCYRAEEKYEAFQYLLEEIRSLTRRQDEVLPSRSDYIGALRAMAFQGNVVAVEDLYEDFLADHGSLSETREVMPALYVHATTGNVTATQVVFDNLGSKYGVVPDTICWNILMLAHARSDEPQNAFEVFETMSSQDIKPDAHTYSTLISLCARRGDLTNALSLLQSAKQHGFKDIRTMLASLVHAYCLHDDLEHAETLLANLDTIDIIGSPVPIWNELLKYHAYRSDPAAVRSVQARMELAGVKLDQYSYGCTLAALIRKSRTSEALKFLRKIHLESRIVATPFLYSLILLGFEREGNRDMVSLIYREMQERFPSVTPSANLSMLKAEVKRGLSKTLEEYKQRKTPSQMHQPSLKQALDFLQQLEHQDWDSDVGKAARGPQPGFIREPAVDAIPSIYPRAVAESFALYERPTQARGVLDWVDEGKYETVGQRPESVRMLTTRLLIAREQHRWKDVDDLWCRIIQKQLKNSLPLLILRNASVDLATTSSDPVAVMEELITRTEDLGAAVLPAQCLALVVPLTRYMLSLDRQNRHDELQLIIEIFQKLGFRLSGSNWNVYVQCLCRSPDPKHRMDAFTIFATILFPFMTTYRVMDKNRWISPETYSETPRYMIDKTPSIPLRLLARVHPEVTPPSYITVVHLARVLLDFEKQAQNGESNYISTVQSRFPEQFKRILQLPRLPDGVQRVLLLRDRRAYRDPNPAVNSPIRHEGALGSQSLLDRLPLEELEWAENLLTSRPPEGFRQESVDDDLALAEMALGEIPREPLWREGRWETPYEQSQRVSRSMQEYIARVDATEKAFREAGLSSGKSLGDPTHKTRWSSESLEDDVRLLDLALNRVEAKDPPQDEATSAQSSSGQGPAATMAEFVETTESTTSTKGAEESVETPELTTSSEGAEESEMTADSAPADPVAQSSASVTPTTMQNFAQNLITFAMAKQQRRKEQREAGQQREKRQQQRRANLIEKAQRRRSEASARRLAAMKSNPGSADLTRVQSLPDLDDRDLTEYDPMAARERRASTPRATIPFERTLYRRFLPPKRRDVFLDLPKERRRLRRAEASLQEARDREYRERLAQEEGLRDGEKEGRMELPMYRQLRQEYDAAAFEARNRDRKVKAAKQAQLERLRRGIGANNPFDDAAQEPSFWGKEFDDSSQFTELGHPAQSSRPDKYVPTDSSDTNEERRRES